jgi:hypothetical protein
MRTLAKSFPSFGRYILIVDAIGMRINHERRVLNKAIPSQI